MHLFIYSKMGTYEMGKYENTRIWRKTDAKLVWNHVTVLQGGRLVRYLSIWSGCHLLETACCTWNMTSCYHLTQHCCQQDNVAWRWKTNSEWACRLGNDQIWRRDITLDKSTKNVLQLLASFFVKYDKMCTIVQLFTLNVNHDKF